MHPVTEHQLETTRRHLLTSAGSGLGTAALAELLFRSGSVQALAADTNGKNSVLPHSSPRIRNVIYLFQNGGPSHVDLFDFKPKLSQLHGSPIPREFVQGKRFSTMTGKAEGKLVLAPVEPFAQYGDSGATVSRFMPHTAQIADQICFIKSMHTDAVNHAPAISFLLSGAQIPGRPTLGAWLSYGLGNEADDLPAFVVMTSVSKGTTCGQIFYDFYWGSGFLPSLYQGVKLRSGGDPVLYLSNPDGMTRQMRRGWLDDLAHVNELHRQYTGDPETATRIAQYEMAFRMQASVPELTDISKESRSTLELYGPQVSERGTFAHNCLQARRLVERGTRFVQVMHAGWDQHNSLTTELYNQCRDTDQPSAALVRDLQQRGLLDETLVIWSGEFGRTPFLQGDLKNRSRWGRDHHPYAFTLWMAGGGIRRGTTYGASDELGFSIAADGVHVHDFQATLLHLLGIDHERLTYRFQGRQHRLTDVHGKVITGVLG